MAVVALFVVFPFLMAYAAASDLLTMRIPNRLSLLLVAAFLLLAAFLRIGWWDFAQHLGAGLATLVVTFTLNALGKIGGGDAKLAAATALWLGFGPLFDYLMFTALAGGVLVVLIVNFRARPIPGFAIALPGALHLHEGRLVPYGVALSAAALIVCPSAPLWQLFLGA